MPKCECAGYGRNVVPLAGEGAIGSTGESDHAALAATDLHAKALLLLRLTLDGC